MALFLLYTQYYHINDSVACLGSTLVTKFLSCRCEKSFWRQLTAAGGGGGDFSSQSEGERRMPVKNKVFSAPKKFDLGIKPKRLGLNPSSVVNIVHQGGTWRMLLFFAGNKYTPPSESYTNIYTKT